MEILQHSILKQKTKEVKSNTTSRTWNLNLYIYPITTKLMNYTRF